ncbi:platelet-activating factor acetylhydrolase, isoform II-domain-containing protein [Melampsora americana]|nr:platelet-activating factor acetylhydrolase, isoform II-domain-containing protein [Melampsora americana]
MTQSQIFKRVPISTRSQSSIDQPNQLHRSVPAITAHPTTSKLNPISQPKRRGRWKWSDIFTPFYLPRFDGTYNVGTLTLELPIPDSIPSQANNPLRLKENPNGPAFELTTSLLTLYYPTNATKAVSSGPTWITLSQIQGYFKFAGLDLVKRIIALPIALFLTARIKLPTLGSVPIAPSASKHNLVLFCHGLTGNRTCYSQYCGQLAARGYVVAAIEHRDRSGAHTVVNSSPRPTQVKYVDMDDLTDETRPENYLIARAYQLELRVIELLAASELLSGFAKPAGWKSIKSSNRRIKGSAGYTGDDGMKWDDKEWDRFSSMVNWDTNVTLAGHSFGSATMVRIAQSLSSIKTN